MGKGHSESQKNLSLDFFHIPDKVFYVYLAIVVEHYLKQN